MGTEAQKLITVSLEKIANFRRRRREMSLHKNLLVTTVIHKARIAIMEETYFMYAAENEAYPASPYAASPSEYAAPPPPTYGCPQSGQVAVADPLRPSDETNMGWESGEDGVAAAATPSSRCEGVEEEDEAEDDDDKENLTPRSWRRAHKRHRAGTTEDEASPHKRVKWEQEHDDDQQLLEEDGDDDTSHALRLVSVLMTGAAAAAGSTAPAAALRLVRSFSNPDLLCSKQASKEGCKEMRTMMDSCANMAIAV